MFVRCLKWTLRVAVLSPILSMSLLRPGAALADSPPDPPAQQQEEPSGGSDSRQRPVLQVGDLIRLKTILPQGRIKGVIQSLDETQISIESEQGETLSVPWPAVKGLDVRTGLRRRWGTGLLITTGVGALLGLAKPEHDTKICVPFGDCHVDEAPSRGSQVAVGAGIGVVAGLIAVGSSPPSAPKWRRVRLPYRPSTAASLGLRIAPGRDGVSVRLVVGF